MRVCALFDAMRWADGSRLRGHLEPYRRRIFTAILGEAADGRPRYNLALMGRAKKNWKSTDLVLAGLFCLVTDSPGGSQCYILANDEGQAADDLGLAKALVAANRALDDQLLVKQKTIERRDGRGFLMILPAQDVAGAHEKTYRFCGFDEIHAYRNWDLLASSVSVPSIRRTARAGPSGWTP